MRAIALPALLLLLAGPALAQQTTDDHASHHRSAASDATELADGEVRRIDKDARKLTLRHGEIRNLDMPRMTMVFQVRDAALLDKVKVGDKVKFRAEKVGPDFVVTAIEAVK